MDFGVIHIVVVLAALQPVSTPLEEAIVGDNCVVKLTGTWDSTNNLPEMVGATKGNLPFNENTTTNLTATASGYSAVLDFEAVWGRC